MEYYDIKTGVDVPSLKVKGTGLLYGFKTEEERTLFLRLIDVKGLGPKVAMPMFATGSVNGIIDAIDRENIVYLTKFPKVGDKLARQIILDLKGKLTSTTVKTEDNEELISVLESLMIQLKIK